MTKGRPRSFCTEKALDAALDVFKRKGYDGASLGELTAAMGINPPSLYAAFGNKEHLYRKALQRYTERICEARKALLAKPDIREAISGLLAFSVSLLTEDDGRTGCLLARSAYACDQIASGAWQDVVAKRMEGVEQIRARLEEAKRKGDLSEEADPTVLARFVAAVMEGMSGQAAAGASRAELEAVAAQAMAAFPG